MELPAEVGVFDVLITFLIVIRIHFLIFGVVLLKHLLPNGLPQTAALFGLLHQGGSGHFVVLHLDHRMLVTECLRQEDGLPLSIGAIWGRLVPS